MITQKVKKNAFQSDKTGCDFSRKPPFSKLRSIQKQTSRLTLAGWIPAEEGGHAIPRKAHPQQRGISLTSLT